VKTTNALKQELKPSSQILIGQSEPMKQVMEMVKKVAVTDAKEDRIGRFEAADKGTLFLVCIDGYLNLIPILPYYLTIQ
jgi:transcriptional regulator with GAF, ATPase, and Fis domain